MVDYVFVSVFVLSAVCLSRAHDVLTLTDSNFQSELARHDLTLVKFYAPWCGHCKKIAPEFEKASTALKVNDPPVTLAEVDCTAEGKESCSTHGVSGYPTLKVFKNGEKAFDYEGPRDADGIVKYMKSKAGPSSKLLLSVDDAVKFLENTEHSIVGFFENEASDVYKKFQGLSSSLSDDFRFAHTTAADVLAKYNYKDDVVIFQPKRLQTKMESAESKFTGDLNKLKEWTKENIHGLVGHRTTANTDQFSKPLVVVYYDVDYVKNLKGTNYWRNRVMKVSKKYSEAGKKITFAISNAQDFNHELTEFGLTYTDDKPVVTARDKDDHKFPMKEDFTVESLEKFVDDFLSGSVKPYLKSEPRPETNDDPVKVVVAETFNEIVNDETKDVLIEFYAPWCGHCKSLAPKYDELATKLKDDEDIVIAKMDATANDVPPPYDVKGFPTLYFAPKGSKNHPKKFEGGREVDDFIKYLAKEASTPLKKYDRDGKKKKKTEL